MCVLGGNALGEAGTFDARAEAIKVDQLADAFFAIRRKELGYDLDRPLEHPLDRQTDSAIDDPFAKQALALRNEIATFWNNPTNRDAVGLAFQQINQERSNEPSFPSIVNLFSPSAWGEYFSKSAAHEAAWKLPRVQIEFDAATGHVIKFAFDGWTTQALHSTLVVEGDGNSICNVTPWQEHGPKCYSSVE